MDRIPEKIKKIPPGGSYFSLEFFPPKTQLGFVNLHSRLERMARALRPLFVSITWGAGGTTSSRSLELAELCQQQLGLTTCLHLTCTNMSPALVDTALDRAKEIGIRNILALRGDPAEDDADDVHIGGTDGTGQFKWAVDLVRYIRNRHGDYFSIGVAAYPEGHADEAYPIAQDPERDIPYLIQKTEAGADFILTQLFFDVNAHLKFEERLRTHESGVFKTIPIIPGLMPIQSYKIMRRTSKLSHAKLPTDLVDRLEPVKDDDAAVKDIGVEYFTDMISQLKASPFPGPSGFHFYTLNLEKVVSQVIEHCKLIPDQPSISNTPEPSSAVATESTFDIANKASKANDGAVDDDNDDVLRMDDLAITQAEQSRRRRRLSSINAGTHNRVIVAKTSARPLITLEAAQDEAGVLSDEGTRANILAISEGEGSLGREATWDDFPNGRWGDSRSPAFGEIDGYGVSLPVSYPEALKLWSSPTTESDISTLFSRYISGTLAAIPWSEDAHSPLSPETGLIANKLKRMNEAGWWTVASQPAVNAARSDDSNVGWGPKNGMVFQKAFVEIFVSSDDWVYLKKQLDREVTNGETLSYFAGQASPQSTGLAGVGGGSSPSLSPSIRSLTTSPDQTSDTVVNPVTWGVFPGKEIVTPTIIQPASFSSWVSEAFDLWNAWRRLYPTGSNSSDLLDHVRKDRWLVCIIHHEYPNENGLWDLLVDWVEKKGGESSKEE